MIWLSILCEWGKNENKKLTHLSDCKLPLHPVFPLSLLYSSPDLLVEIHPPFSRSGHMGPYVSRSGHTEGWNPPWSMTTLIVFPREIILAFSSVLLPHLPHISSSHLHIFRSEHQRKVLNGNLSWSTRKVLPITIKGSWQKGAGSCRALWGNNSTTSLSLPFF